MGGHQARSPLALAVDGPAAGDDLDPGPDGVAVAARPDQLEADPVIAGRGVVAEQGGRAVLVVDDDVDVAVVVEVAERGSVADVVGVEVGPGVARRPAGTASPARLRWSRGGWA